MAKKAETEKKEEVKEEKKKEKVSQEAFEKKVIELADKGLTAEKILCGKTVDTSDSTYLTTIKLRQHFIQLKKFLTINEQPQVEQDKIESLNMAIAKLQEELTSQKIINEAITKENLKQKSELQKLKKDQMITEKKVDTIMTTLFQSGFKDLVRSSADKIVDKQKKK